MTADLMKHAPVASDFGPLPDAGAELNGDALQTLVRLAPMTGDRRFLEWAERIGDAYVREVLPKNHGLPGYTWDFTKHEGPDRMRLRDHGNEMVVGLVLLEALEAERCGERGSSYRGAARPHARPHPVVGQPRRAALRRDPRRRTSRRVSEHLSDNWGYVYGAVYTHFMVTGEERYREAVRRVLRNLPHYRGHDWESGSQDGYADAIESALYLVNREPVPEALDWIESETARLIAFQQEDGTIERWYGDGNWARTLLLYAMMKTQGAFLDGWQEGVRLGAVRDGERLFVSLEAPAGWTGRLRFDHARHRRDLNFAAQLRPPQRVARVVHGGREHPLPPDGRGRPRDRPPGLGPRGRDRGHGHRPLGPRAGCVRTRARAQKRHAGPAVRARRSVARLKRRAGASASARSGVVGRTLSPQAQTSSSRASCEGAEVERTQLQRAGSRRQHERLRHGPADPAATATSPGAGREAELRISIRTATPASRVPSTQLTSGGGVEHGHREVRAPTRIPCRRARPQATSGKERRRSEGFLPRRPLERRAQLPQDEVGQRRPVDRRARLQAAMQLDGDVAHLHHARQETTIAFTDVHVKARPLPVDAEKENGPAGDPAGPWTSADQNDSFAANWMLRSVVPQRAQDGFESIVVIVRDGRVADRAVRGLGTAGGSGG